MVSSISGVLNILMMSRIKISVRKYLKTNEVRALGLVVFLSSFYLSGCGNEVAEATFRYTLDANAAAVIGDGSGVTVRTFYSFDGLRYISGTNNQRAFVVEPASAEFAYESATVNGTTIKSFRQYTARNPGYNAQTASFTLHSLPLNHRGTFFGIDFLKPCTINGVTVQCVVAVGCFQPYAGVFNKDVLNGYASQVLTIQKGRNCGDCTSINDYGSDSAAACPL